MFRFATTLGAGILGVLALCPAAHATVAVRGTGARAAVMTTARALTVTGTAVSPGTTGVAVPVTATLSNPNGFHLWAHTVTATFGSASKGCTASSYRVDGSPLAVGRAVAPGTNTLPVTGISVTLLASKCKGATVTLVWAVT